MESLVRENVFNHNLISENEKIVIGVSGGADSMALLYSLNELRKEMNFDILVAHVNHGVRGEDALRDQLFVERKAKELNLPYYSRNVDMVSYGKEKGITAEEAGRELRYGFFREILKEVGGGKIAVAHNKNDQAETLLLRILRGTGIDGLKGMEFLTGDIIRPILNIERLEIEKYVKDNNIEFVTDKTNLEPIYSRNKIRLELIPYIIDNFNPNIINTLWRLSQISAMDSRFLEDYSRNIYNYLVKSHCKNSIILKGVLFQKENKSIQQRIIRNAIMNINNTLQGFTEIHISSVVDLFTSGETGKKLYLPDNIIAKVSYEDLIIEKGVKEEHKDYVFNLKVGCNIIDEIGYLFEVKIINSLELREVKDKKNIRYFDYDRITGSLKVRNRRAGDKFAPFGMKGTKKLKDYFMDEKVTRDFRNHIPIIVDEKEILWVVGYRTSEHYKVTKDTRNILLIKYNRISHNEEEAHGESNKGSFD